MHLSKCRVFLCSIALLTSLDSVSRGQSLGGAGTIDGVVTDPSGAAVPNASVTISNSVSGFQKKAATDANGGFRLRNVPPNSYHMEVSAPAFNPYVQDLVVRTTVPISLKIPLTIAAAES